MNETATDKKPATSAPPPSPPPPRGPRLVSIFGWLIFGAVMLGAGVVWAGSIQPRIAGAWYAVFGGSEDSPGPVGDEQAAPNRIPAQRRDVHLDITLVAQHAGLAEPGPGLRPGLRTVVELWIGAVVVTGCFAEQRRAT